jgi:branched-chain amino acid transport system substrate-binding protein
MVNMSSHVVRRAIASFFSKKTRQDLLLLYFSGHGVLDDQGQLFLAVRDTDSQLLSGTAIPASYITTEMNNSHSQRQVLVLDCCHSGAFARGTKGQIGSSVGTGTAFEGTGYGRVVLTASDATQFAWEGEQVIGRAENSLFTHYLVEGIQTGKADLDADGQITVDELYDYTYEQVIRQTPRQTPGKWSYKEQGEIVLAKAPSPASRGSQQVKIPDFDQDQEQRLDQLYNEGLSAYWLEEWDKAVRCFETLVELRGDYLDALNKLELSRRNKRLLALYDQALAAGEAGDWSQAIARLEELTSTAPDYKDAAARLDRARRARQLDNLYQEARQLSQAGKWQAVTNIFANIAELQPDYPDPDALLPAARLKVAEIERRQTMDDLYRRALLEMDVSNWKVAQELLVELETMETGYRGADRLLAKLESKIAEQQAVQERAAHIAVLYEQSLVLLGARHWSQALDKMGELRKLEPQFDDSEGIEKKAQAEIEREKAEARRRIQLDASYAQAVQLLEARQYQQALEQWGQVQAIDPAYPDRKKVQATAKKKLKELTQVSTPKGGLPRWALAALGLLGVLGFILILTYPDWGKRLTQQDEPGLPAAAVPATSPTSTSAAVPTQSAELAAEQTATDESGALSVSVEGPIKIAILVPLSGPVPTFGVSTRDGAILAIEEWNARGGVLGCQIEYIIEDSQCTPGPAVNAANKVIEQDGVKYIIGEICSIASIPVSEISEEKGVVQISPTSTNPKVTLRDDGSTKEYVFRACFIDTFQGLVKARFALAQGHDTAFILFDQGNDYVLSLSESFEENFVAGGGTIVGKESYTGQDTDFSASLTKVVDSNADVLYVPDYYNIVNLVGSQAKERGITAVLMGGDGWDSADLDRAAADGGYYSNHYSPFDTRPIVQDWVANYEARFGEVPDALATLAYDAANLLLASIEEAGVDDPSMVKDVLAAIDYEAVSGRVTFDEFHNPVKSVTIVQVRDGEIQFVDSVPP